MFRSSLLVAVLLLSCGSEFFVRYANSVPTMATTPGGEEQAAPLRSYSTLPPVPAERMVARRRGSYVRFVIDRLCFGDLPGFVRDNADDSWVSVTTVSGHRGAQAGPLFQTFRSLSEEAVDSVGVAARRAAFANENGVLPPYGLPTNARGCIPGAQLAPSLPVVLSQGEEQPPASLFVVSAAFYEEAHALRRRFGAAGGAVADLVGDLGSEATAEDVRKIRDRLDDASQLVFQLLSVVRPEQHFLWAEVAVPVTASDDERQVMVPREDERFVYIFTEPERFRVDTLEGGGDVAQGCVRTQRSLQPRLDGDEVLFGHQASNVSISADPDAPANGCPSPEENGTVPIETPYLVWHIDHMDSLPEGRAYLDEYQQLASSAALRREPLGGWTSKLRALEELRGEIGRVGLVSREHQEAFYTLESALEDTVAAIGLAGDATRPVCEALDATKQAKRSAELLLGEGFHHLARSATTDIIESLQRRANADGLACAQTSFYPDRDGDGYGDSAAQATLADSAPENHVANNDDCFDGSADVHPSQTRYFRAPAEGRPSSDAFDYDCSGANDPHWTRVTPNRPCWRDGGLLGRCTSHVGWLGSRPQCGDTHAWVTSCRTAGASCNRTVSSPRTQECR